eukprot:479304-Rhodomonas_salina.1
MSGTEAGQHPMTCPYWTWRMFLCARYASSGTDAAYGATRPRSSSRSTVSHMGWCGRCWTLQV